LNLHRVFFVLRNVLAGVPVTCAALVAWFGSPPTLRHWGAGAVVVALGVGVRAWSKCHNDYGRRRGKVLVTSGPYSVVQNPLYVGSALIIGGIALCSGHMLGGVAGFLWAIAIYNGVAALERGRLIERYGETYLRYAEQVPRWLPRTMPTQSFEIPLADWLRTLRAESVSLWMLLPFLALVPSVRAWLTGA
jgi:protein-S-isoprenylcysteine O-methyltransferase Ste14